MADKPAEQKMGPELSSVLNFIPSAYYDLIARVCPGLALSIGGSLFLAMLFRQAMFLGRVADMHKIYVVKN